MRIEKIETRKNEFRQKSEDLRNEEDFIERNSIGDSNGDLVSLIRRADIVRKIVR